MTCGPLMLGQLKEFRSAQFDAGKNQAQSKSTWVGKLIGPGYHTKQWYWDAVVGLRLVRTERCCSLSRMERSKGEAWSPLATVEEIQRRLVRPSSLPPASFWNDIRSREDLQTKKEAKTREMENKKLEDYLDPALLSVVSSKIGRQKKDVKMKKQKREIEKFQWPVDELNVFVDDSRMMKTMDWSSDEVIDLKNDNEID